MSVAHLSPVVATGAATADSLASAASTQRDVELAWQRVVEWIIDRCWHGASELEEDDLIPPTRAAVVRAIGVARALQEFGEPPPMRVVPDGDGGLAFERWHGERMTTIMILCSGSVEILRWQGCKITGCEEIG